MTRLLVLALLFSPLSARAAPPYGWSPPGDAETLSHRFPAPAGFSRVPTGGFGAWLRDLPLAPAGTPVLLFDGRHKPRQDVHAAVIAIDVGQRDLQQCADAVMRLRAEYLLWKKQPIAFHPDPGKATALRFETGDRKAFMKYMTRVFGDAGSASLQAELPKATAPVEPGDVLIQGGHPGHAIMVLDVAADGSGKRKLLLAQSYMPAQSMHVLLVDVAHPERGAWYDERALDDAAGLMTPEWWRPFKRADVRRFR